jgi:hypothetical protein
VVLLKQLQLLHPAVLRLLRLKVAPPGRLIGAARRHKLPPGPEVCPHNIPLPPPRRPGNMHGALPLQIPSPLRHRRRGGNRQHQGHVSGLPMPLFAPALFLAGSLAHYVSPVAAQLPGQDLAAIFRNNHHVLFAFPLRLT